jgi:transposase
MWCVGELDGEYIARMEDVLTLYEKPLSEQEPVVCIDEKPVVLHADLRPPRPMYPGRTLRRDSEYERRGTANPFCGVEPKAGRHYPRVTPDRSSPEFADYLLEIAEHYPAANTIHLVMDNLSSHTRKAVVERYGEKAGGWLWDRFTVHYTPKHGSWLNQAEIEISLFSRQCLGQRRIPSLEEAWHFARGACAGDTNHIDRRQQSRGYSPRTGPPSLCLMSYKGTPPIRDGAAQNRRNVLRLRTQNGNSGQRFLSRSSSVETPSAFYATRNGRKDHHVVRSERIGKGANRH